MTEHTPTPWKFESHIIEETNGIFASIRSEADVGGFTDVAYLTLPQAGQNAAFIVKACNSYDALVKALQEARQFVADGGCDEDDSEVVTARNELLERISRLVEGGKEP